MGYPAGEKQYGCCGSHIGGIGTRTGEIEKIAAMIDSHNEHYRTAQNVDGIDALFGCWRVGIGHISGLVLNYNIIRTLKIY